MDRRREELRDLCALLGGLLLDGASLELLEGLRRAAGDGGIPGAEVLGAAAGDLAAAVTADGPEAQAAEYTRLFVVDGSGARRPLPVPPWEDCWSGAGREVLGERSRAALRFYAGSGWGFEGMTSQPADHVGLELCFVAALLDEELGGERDDSLRRRFVAEHLGRFAPSLGAALVEHSRSPLWREVGRTVAALPEPLGGKAGRGAEASVGGA